MNKKRVYTQKIVQHENTHALRVKSVSLDWNGAVL